MKKTANNTRKNTAKIYFSFDPNPRLYWKVNVKNARQKVVIAANITHALTGYPGSTISCLLSNCSCANKDAFPHPCFLAAFTATTAYIVTKLKDGAAVEAVRYLHSYRQLVDLNDRGVSDEFIKLNPQLFERSFTLRPYKAGEHRGGSETGEHGSRRILSSTAIHKGALKRAVTAGLIPPSAAQAIERMVVA